MKTNLSPTPGYASSSFSNSFLKAIIGIISYSKVFEDIFEISFECSQPRVFAPLQSFSKDYDANHHVTNHGE
jgi:hypothetical protein